MLKPLATIVPSSSRHVAIAGIAAEEEAQKLEHLDVSRDREKVEVIFAALEREVRALADELSALARDALADREKPLAEGKTAGKKNPGERRGRLNAQREGGARDSGLTEMIVNCVVTCYREREFFVEIRRLEMASRLQPKIQSGSTHVTRCSPDYSVGIYLTATAASGNERPERVFD